MATTSGLTGIATNDLGLSLPAQVKAETDEDKKKRLQMMQQMSPGAMSLLGPTQGMSGGR